MKDRIEKLVQYLGLNAKTFAEKIGTTQPNISNILRERNKPSLEIVQKILSAYPAISSDWLVLGKGEMFTKNEGNVSADDKYRILSEINEAQNSQKLDDNGPTIPFEDELQEVDNKEYTSTLEDDVESKSDAEIEANKRSEKSDEIEKNEQSEPNEPSINEEMLHYGTYKVNPPVHFIGAKAKTIKKVIMLYTDGSFEEYQMNLLD